MQQSGNTWSLEYKGKRIAQLFLTVNTGQNERVFEMRPECDAAELAMVFLLLKDQLRQPQPDLVLRNESDGFVMEHGEFRLSPAMIMKYYAHVKPVQRINWIDRIRNVFQS